MRLENKKPTHNTGYNPLLGLVFKPKVCVILLGLIPTSENPSDFTRNGIIAEPLAVI